MGAGSHECVCHAGYETADGGKTCTTIQECASSPCMNGSTCVDGACTYAACLFQFSCVCADGWAGTLCEVNLDECSSYPCGAGSTCVDWIFSYVCVCGSGYAGYNCVVDVNECASSPCANGGTCAESGSSSLVPSSYYQCTCPAGFTGYDCETDIEECGSSPCQNGSTCVSDADAYKCKCPTGFSGFNCEVDMNECLSLPCLNKGVCMDSASSVQVGSVISFGVYKCTCGAGFTGFNCETDINECASSPCANGATCLESTSHSNIGVGSTLSMGVTNAYMSALHNSVAGAMNDGKLTAAELAKDPEGAALLNALQTQIATQLGISTNMVVVNNIATNAVSGRRLLDAAETAEDATHALPPTMSREDYYTVPSAHELAAMPVSRLRSLHGFRVGRVGYGEVRWLGDIDVTNVDLDSVVFIERGDVSVYSDESDVPKPPVGTKLNSPAVIALQEVRNPVVTYHPRTTHVIPQPYTRSIHISVAHTVIQEK